MLSFVDNETTIVCFANCCKRWKTCCDLDSDKKWSRLVRYEVPDWKDDTPGAAREFAKNRHLVRRYFPKEMLPADNVCWLRFNGFQLSPSNRAICLQCSRWIEKDTLRHEQRNPFGGQGRRCTHFSCWLKLSIKEKSAKGQQVKFLPGKPQQWPVDLMLTIAKWIYVGLPCDATPAILGPSRKKPLQPSRSGPRSLRKAPEKEKSKKRRRPQSSKKRGERTTNSDNPAAVAVDRVDEAASTTRRAPKRLRS